MRYRPIHDKKYLYWVRGLPCIRCGLVSQGRAFRREFRRCNRDGLYKEMYTWNRVYSAVHHVGDGIHTPRSNDHLVVPVCDTFCNPCVNNSCHSFFHRNIKEIRKELIGVAEELYRRYEKEVLGVL